MPSPVNPYSDYGVALRTLGSARSWLALLLFVCITAQFVGFSVMWWTHHPYKAGQAKFYVPERTRFDDLAETLRRMIGNNNSTQPAPNDTAVTPEVFFPGTHEGRKLNIREQWETTYAMAIPLTQMLGLLAAGSMAILVFISLLIILIAQAPGVAQTIKAFKWTILLLFIVIPWQYLGNIPFRSVLYGYDEMLRMIGPHVVGEKTYPYQLLLTYLRFVAWPVISLIILLTASEKFRSGLMLAIGHPLQSMIQGRPGAAQRAMPGADKKLL